MAAAKKGMGFAAAQKSIVKKSGVSMKSAGAILATGARKASPAALKANPNLKKVSGVSGKKDGTHKMPNGKMMKDSSMKKAPAKGSGY